LPVIDKRLIAVIIKTNLGIASFIHFHKNIAMKKVLFLGLLLAGLAAKAAIDPEISEKVLKAFNETFATAKDVTWQEVDNNCQATFKQSEMKIRAIYDNEGNLLQTVRYYNADNLPPNILAKLKKKYAGKVVFGVTEITTDTEVTYQITLKDDKNWYTIQSDPYANLQQLDKFKRADPAD
jgi:hypothetical protein